MKRISTSTLGCRARGSGLQQLRHDAAMTRRRVLARTVAGHAATSGTRRSVDRVVDYSAALRIAALRLTGDLPTMDEINQVANAADDAAKKTAYEALIDNYMARPTFARQMF